MFSYIRAAIFGMHLFGRWAAAIVVALLAVSLASCGQSSAKTGQSKTTNPSAAVAAGQTSSQAASDYVQAMLEWTRCVRANGVPDFPDPNAKGRFHIDRKRIDVNSEAFKNAMKACADKFPSGVQNRPTQSDSDLLTQALQYAQCMRANGLPNFPDPQVIDGRVNITLPAGLDRNSDVFRKAQATCGSKRPSGLGG